MTQNKIKSTLSPLSECKSMNPLDTGGQKYEDVRAMTAHYGVTFPFI